MGWASTGALAAWALLAAAVVSAIVVLHARARGADHGERRSAAAGLVFEGAILTAARDPWGTFGRDVAVWCARVADGCREDIAAFSRLESCP